MGVAGLSHGHTHSLQHAGGPPLMCDLHPPLAHSSRSQTGEAISSAVHSPLGVAPEDSTVEGMDTAELPSQSGSTTTAASELWRLEQGIIRVLAPLHPKCFG